MAYKLDILPDFLETVAVIQEEIPSDPDLVVRKQHYLLFLNYLNTIAAESYRTEEEALRALSHGWGPFATQNNLLIAENYRNIGRLSPLAHLQWNGLYFGSIVETA